MHIVHSSGIKILYAHTLVFTLLQHVMEPVIRLGYIKEGYLKSQCERHLVSYWTNSK